MWKASDSDCSLSFMGKKLSVLLLWLILGLSLLMLPAFPAQAEVTSYLSGNEANVNPTLAAPVCRIIGSDIKDVEFSFPIGLPLCRSLSGYKDLWEVRSKITGGKIARIIFYISNGEMILLHGFIKKSQKTPKKEIELAVKRQKEHQQHDR